MENQSKNKQLKITANISPEGVILTSGVTLYIDDKPIGLVQDLKFQASASKESAELELTTLDWDDSIDDLPETMEGLSALITKIDSLVPEDQPDSLYSYGVDMGRQGRINGTILATAEEIEDIIGKNIYFGEILGKHSEVSITCEREDFELLTSDQEFIKKAVEYNLIPSGYNPLDYVEEDDYDGDDEEDDSDDEEDDSEEEE